MNLIDRQTNKRTNERVHEFLKGWGELLTLDGQLTTPGADMFYLSVCLLPGRFGVLAGVPVGERRMQWLGVKPIHHGGPLSCHLACTWTTIVLWPI